MLTNKRLRELLSYDPATGIFTWKIANSRRIHVGDKAGTVARDGYVIIGVDGKLFRAHTLAWQYVHGRVPAKHLQIDHINGSRGDNRLVNLRLTTRSGNQHNQRSAHKNNKSGLLGVSKIKDEEVWVSSIWVNGCHIRLGRFKSPHEAHAAYLKAKRKYHPTNTL